MLVVKDVGNYFLFVCFVVVVVAFFFFFLSRTRETTN